MNAHNVDTQFNRTKRQQVSDLSQEKVDRLRELNRERCDQISQLTAANRQLKEENQGLHDTVAKLTTQLFHSAQEVEELRKAHPSELTPEEFIKWLKLEADEDDLAMINARDHGEWNRYHSLEGHRTALIHVVHHIRAAIAREVK